MKTIQLFLPTLMVASAFCQTDSLGDSFREAKQVFDSLKPPTKSEFETSAEFEKRKAAALSTILQSPVVFVLDRNLPMATRFKYDAEKSIMTAEFPLNQTKAFIHTTVAAKEAARTQKKKNKNQKPLLKFDALQIDGRFTSREATAQNGFGATFNIKISDEEDYYLATTNELTHIVSIPMSLEAAKEIKPFLKMGVTCTILDEDIHNDFYSLPATARSPLELNFFSRYLDAKVIDLFIFDGRDGRVLIRLPQQ